MSPLASATVKRMEKRLCENRVPFGARSTHVCTSPRDLIELSLGSEERDALMR